MQISPGGQGFRSDLPNSTWYNNGLTGEDYVGLMSIPEIAFGTVHFCEALTPPAMSFVLRCTAPACVVVPEIADYLQCAHAMQASAGGGCLAMTCGSRGTPNCRQTLCQHS